MMANGEVTAPYGLVVPDPAPASSITRVCPPPSAPRPCAALDHAPDTKRTPELAMAELSAMSRSPDTVDETQASPSTISSIISCMDSSAPITSAMEMPPMQEAQSPLVWPDATYVASPPLDPAHNAAHPRLVAPASQIAYPQAAPASWDGMVYAPALGTGSTQLATRPDAIATFLATFATTPAQRLYVVVTTLAMTVMATLIVVLAVGRATTHAPSPTAAPAGDGATTTAGTPAATPSVVVCVPSPSPAAALPSDPAGPVAQAETIEIPEAQPPVVRNARRAVAPRSTNAPPRR